jgi:Ca-activated chloride channel family protein
VSFDLPLLLFVAPGAALLLAGLSWLARRRRVRAADRWSVALGALARRSARFGAPLVGLAGLLAATGAAGPRWGSTDVATESRALNLVIAIDVSRSMLAEDASPNRLQRAIREARRLLQDARGDRIALLAFAGRSYILTPLTLDDGAVRLQLDALDPEIASEGGTELAPVLRQGAQLLDAASEGGARALVLFTDGEGHDSLSGALEAARALRRAGATLIVVGEGSPAPTRIPIRDPAGSLVEFKKDASGAEVFTARRDDVLRAVADAGRGILVPGDFPDQAGAIWKTLAGLDRSTAFGRRTEDQLPRAWLFALGAALLLGLQAARRPAALLGVLLLAGSGSAMAQRPAPGLLRAARGDTARAVRAFADAARAGRAPDTSWYNAGTLAMEAGDDESAREALGAALASLDPALRFRSLYNLGLAALRRSRSDSARRTELEREAATRLREALLLDPRHEAAKWNLELVSRRRPPPPSGGGQTPRPRSGPGEGPPPPPSSSGMSRSEAEQILASVERTEEAVRADQLRRRRPARSAGAKDW